MTVVEKVNEQTDESGLRKDIGCLKEPLPVTTTG